MARVADDDDEINDGDCNVFMIMKVLMKMIMMMMMTMISSMMMLRMSVTDGDDQSMMVK